MNPSIGGGNLPANPNFHDYGNASAETRDSRPVRPSNSANPRNLTGASATTKPKNSVFNRPERERPSTSPNKANMAGANYKIGNSNERSAGFNPFTGEENGTAPMNVRKQELVNAREQDMFSGTPSTGAFVIPPPMNPKREISSEFQRNLAAANSELQRAAAAAKI